MRPQHLLRGATFGAALLLAACAAAPMREAPPVAAPAPLPAPPPPSPPPVAAPRLPPAPVSPWERLRRSFALGGCEARPGVLLEAERYTRSQVHFSESWNQAMPFLLLVLDEVERRGMPGEFAMLPYVESGYRPVSGGGSSPAGMWQLTATTARGLGLAVNDSFDARLDALAATRAALELLDGYHERFDNWHLANHAFNSGEFRVRRLLDGREPARLSPQELSTLGLPKTSHEHLDRLLALACIIEAPERFGVRLPEPTPDHHLSRVRLESPMDLRLAARLAGLPEEDLLRWNAGWRQPWMEGSQNLQLLLPAPAVARFQSAAKNLPADWWRGWRQARAPETIGLAEWARQLDIPVEVLASANGMPANGRVAAGDPVLVPGTETSPAPAAPPTARVHVVGRGDTLWQIARRHGMALGRLQALNPGVRTLRPGQRLRLSAE